MSRLLKIVGLCVLTVVLQTTICWRISASMVAPDLIVVMLTLLIDYTGAASALCAGAFMALLYDASVGSLLGVNLITYAIIGLAGVYAYPVMDKRLSKLKRRHLLSLVLSGVILTSIREIVSLGYLFLTGSEWQNVAWVSRPISMILSNTVTIVIFFWPVRRLMRWHPLDDLSAYIENKKAERREKRERRRQQKAAAGQSARHKALGKSSSAARR